MYKNQTFLGIIPARKGSKGLPGKNIKNLHGKPLIAWSIQSGLKSKYLDEVIVTTNCEETIKIAKHFGAKTPFIRPEYLSEDETSSFDVLLHTINYYKQLNQEFDYIVLLEPTSPLREVKDIDLAIENLLSSNAQSIVGVSLTEDQNPAFLVKLDQNNYLNKYDIKSSTLRRQDIDDVYFYEGSIYISETKSYLSNKSFYHSKTIAHVIPKFKSLEIDDIYDFLMVESIMKYHNY
ncbi:MAG: acylneuraminate cytidylyltransferase [Candidatus Cloacimonadota bacterium]|nr:MAG: acylneuraminate cytidylyltransferase [Candidatus Cloacimonadota bacterium]